MNTKYKLTDETMEYNGHTLHRIVALKDFGDVKKGDKGGWVESEDNLSQDGDCWVDGYAKAYERAQVRGNALVLDNAQVYGCAEVIGCAEVCGAARVFDVALVTHEARVFNNAQVFGYARVRGDVCGNAQVCGGSHVIANAILCAGITNSEDDYVVVGPQGSRHSYATYHIPSDTVCTGCFKGTLKEFESAVEKTHKNNAKYLRQYKLVISVFNTYRSHYGAGQSEAKQ